MTQLSAGDSRSLEQEFDASQDEAAAAKVHAEIAALEQHGNPVDPRDDIDPASLRARFPHLRPVQIDEFAVDSLEGGLRARLYTSVEVDHGVGFVWIHGGGWIGGTLDAPESGWVAMELAARGITVVALEYRKALNGARARDLQNDVLAGWTAATEMLSRRGIVPARQHLGGASAGSALSAGLTLRLRDSDARRPATVTLVYPMVHSALPPLSADVRAALTDLPTEFVLSPKAARVYATNVLGSDGLIDPYMFPGDDESVLAGQPPILIISAERDALRASSEFYATQLEAAGVDVTHEVQPAIVHGHLDHPGEPGAIITIDRMTDWLLGSRQGLT